MKLEGWNSDDVLGLEKFYASGCVWTISEMKSSSGKYASRAVEWVQSSPTPKEYPVLLPRVVEPNGIYWYAIAFSEAQSEQLRGDLTAFVGSAGTDAAQGSPASVLCKALGPKLCLAIRST